MWLQRALSVLCLCAALQVAYGATKGGSKGASGSGAKSSPSRSRTTSSNSRSRSASTGSIRSSNLRSFATGAAVGYIAGRGNRQYYYRNHYYYQSSMKGVCSANVGRDHFLEPANTSSGNLTGGAIADHSMSITVYFECGSSEKCCGDDCCADTFQTVWRVLILVSTVLLGIGLRFFCYRGKCRTRGSIGFGAFIHPVPPVAVRVVYPSHDPAAQVQQLAVANTHNPNYTQYTYTPPASIPPNPNWTNPAYSGSAYIPQNPNRTANNGYYQVVSIPQALDYSANDSYNSRMDPNAPAPPIDNHSQLGTGQYANVENVNTLDNQSSNRPKYGQTVSVCVPGESAPETETHMVGEEPPPTYEEAVVEDLLDRSPRVAGTADPRNDSRAQKDYHA